MSPTTASANAPRWSLALEEQYALLAKTLERLIPCLEVPLHLPWIDAINMLKRARRGDHGAQLPVA
jgi:quinolinate synthase